MCMNTSQAAFSVNHFWSLALLRPSFLIKTQHFPLFSPAVRPRRRRRLLRARLRASLEGEGRGGQEVVLGERVREKIKKNHSNRFPVIK